MKTPHWEVGTNLGDAAPIRIYGDLYFVGTQPASTHIIDSTEGLIMLDSGYRQSLQLVLSHMREVGLDPMDIRYILHTHGHLDHAAATAELVRMTGAKTFIGKEDREYVNGSVDLTYSREYGMVWDDPFEPDVLLSDGDEIRLGKTVIKCIATPGHTPGAMSYLFDVEENGVVLRAALHGGAGINTMSSKFLDKYGLSYDCRDKFLVSMDKLAGERVDIFLGNHMQHNNTLGKTERVLSGDRMAFADPYEWQRYLLSCKKAVLDMIKSEERI